MSWDFYANRFETSDFAGAPLIYQPFTLPRDTRVKALRTWFVFYNNPVFDSLTMRIYGSNNGVIGDLLTTFDKVWTLSEITTFDYASLEIWFDFTNEFWLSGGVEYFLAPDFDSPSFSSSSHVSWVKGFPDPNTTTFGEDVLLTNLNNLPYYIAFISDEIEEGRPV